MIDLMLNMFPEGPTRLWARNEKGMLFSVLFGPEREGGFSITASATEPGFLGAPYVVAERKATSATGFTDADADAMMTEVATEVLGPVDLLRLLAAWSVTGPAGK